jgi:plastocyanin
MQEVLNMKIGIHRIVVLAAAAVIGSLAAGVQAAPALAGGGCHYSAFQDHAVDRVDLKLACFSPNVARVAKGGQVTFRNSDDMDHTVSGASGSFGTLDTLRTGQSVTYRFDSEGVFPYYCMFHPGMVGAIVVGTGAASASGPAAAVRVQPTPAAVHLRPVAGSAGPPLAAWALLLCGAVVVALTTLFVRRRRGRLG